MNRQDKAKIHIEAERGWQFIDFHELKEYRDLFFFLVLRDIKVRYKQTVLGGLWAIIQPFFMMMVFTFFFGRLAKIPSDGVPYPVFNYSAMVAWTYFAAALTNSGNSLINSTSLVSKVYFPRLIIPLAPVLAGLLDFALAFLLLVGMMFYFQIIPTRMIVFLPLMVVIMVFAAAGTGMFLAALNAKYRDIKYTIAFILQFWMFMTPVVYPASMVPEKYRILYALNPMVGVIEGFRAVLLGCIAFPMDKLLISFVVSSALLLFGACYFKQTERYFADII